VNREIGARGDPNDPITFARTRRDTSLAQVPATRHVGAWTGRRRSTPLPPARCTVSAFRWRWRTAAAIVSGVWTSQIGRRVEAAVQDGRTPAAARRFRAGLAGRRRGGVAPGAPPSWSDVSNYQHRRAATEVERRKGVRPPEPGGGAETSTLRIRLNLWSLV